MTTPKPTHSQKNIISGIASLNELAESFLIHTQARNRALEKENKELRNAHDALVEIALLAEDICRLLAEGKPVPLNYAIQKIDKALRLTGEETK